MALKAIYIDFDGCLSPAIPGVTLDIDLVHVIRDLNKRSQDVPFVAINSGRPESFIEAHAQVFDIKNFCVFENGAGIFRFPSETIEMHLDPRIPETIHEDFLAMVKLVKAKFGISRQPNKEYNLTYLFPEKDPRIKQVTSFLDKHIMKDHLPYYIDTGINFINVIVAGTNKGTGLQMIVEHTGIDPADIAGIGDSNCDWEFMKFCGFTACPSNASDDLKKKVNYVSPLPYAKGTIDIIEHILKSQPR
nr:HAD-IIB family hydrolase [Candidatus Sigynarchaeota archaeon]